MLVRIFTESIRVTAPLEMLWRILNKYLIKNIGQNDLFFAVYKTGLTFFDENYFVMTSMIATHSWY